MIWLGSKRGYVTDWFTQRWVQFTGRRVCLTAQPWLAGPISGDPAYHAALPPTILVPRHARPFPAPAGLVLLGNSARLL